MATLQLYPFRFRDPLTGQWVRAMYKLRVPELRLCYRAWEITDAPQFNPFGMPAQTRTGTSDFSDRSTGPNYTAFYLDLTADD
jgi:hypothetical protein